MILMLYRLLTSRTNIICFNNESGNLALSFFFFLMIRRPPRSPLFPYPTLFQSLLTVFAVGHASDPLPLYSSRCDSPRRPPACSVPASSAPRERAAPLSPPRRPRRSGHRVDLDRKSTRLNSSHLVISYAVFCLKK